MVQKTRKTPVKVGSLVACLIIYKGFFTSKVVQDFFHRQYGYPHDLQVVTMSQPFLAGISSTINLLYDKKGLAPIPNLLPEQSHVTGSFEWHRVSVVEAGGQV